MKLLNAMKECTIGLIATACNMEKDTSLIELEKFMKSIII